MRNLIKFSLHDGFHYSVQSKPSCNNDVKAKDNDEKVDVFCASGLDIPTDNIDDVPLRTDISDYFFNEVDFDGYFDGVEDSCNLVVTDDHRSPVPVPQETSSTKYENSFAGLDVPTDEINEDLIKVIDLESGLFLDKLAHDISGFFDTDDLLLTQEKDGNSRKEEARVKDDDDHRSSFIPEDHRRRFKRTAPSQETAKSAMAKNSNKADMEIKLTDMKRKLCDGDEDNSRKKQKIKIIYDLPPQTIPKQPSKKKGDLLKLKNDLQVLIPKKPHTCDHKRKDDLSKRLKNDLVRVPVLEKVSFTCQKRKDEASRPKKDQVPKNLNKADTEIKLTDMKRKVSEGYEDKARNKRKIKMIDYIPPQTVLV